MLTTPHQPGEWVLLVIVFSFMLGIMIKTSIYYQTRIDLDRIPFWWNRDGTPRRFTSKTLAVWYFPGLAVVGAAAFLALGFSSLSQQRLFSTIFMFSLIGLMSQQPIHGVALIQWMRLRERESLEGGEASA